jgi:hypothetical protein
MSAGHHQQQHDANERTFVPLVHQQTRTRSTADQKASHFAEGIRKLDHDFRSERQPYNVDRWLSGVDDTSSSNERAVFREPYDASTSPETYRTSHTTTRPASTALHASTRISDGHARPNFAYQVPTEGLYAFTGAWVNDNRLTKVRHPPCYGLATHTVTNVHTD